MYSFINAQKDIRDHVNCMMYYKKLTFHISSMILDQGISDQKD